MANTETQLLKFIWENKGKASWLRIVKELRFFSPDYCRLICQGLIKKKFVKFSEGQYKIANLGKKELVKLGLREKVSKESQPRTTTSCIRGKLPTEPVEKVAKPKRPKKPKTKIAAKREIKEEVKGTPLTELLGLTPKLTQELKKRGFRTIEDVAITSVSRLMEAIESLELKQAARIINEARSRLRKEGKEYLWE